MLTVTTPKEVIDAVTSFIAQGNPDLAEKAANELRPRLADHATLEHAQAEVNRYWRMQLAVLDVSTYSIREYLLDNQPMVGWLRNFRDHVAPFVIQHVKI